MPELETFPVGKSKASQPPDDDAAERPTVSVKLKPSVHRRLRMVASDRHIDLTELLDEIVNPVSVRLYRDLRKRMDSEEDE